MSAEIWFIISIVGFSLAAAALIAAVILFIKLNIPAVIGDLTGRTVAREIKAMKETNFNKTNVIRTGVPSSSAAGAKAEVLSASAPDIRHDSMAVAHASKQLDKLYSVENDKKSVKKTGTTGLSDVLKSNESDPTDILPANSTEVLSSSDEYREGANRTVTESLSDNATESLDAGATEVLSNNATESLDAGATEVLSNNATESLGAGATEVLSNNATESLGAGATEVLSNNATESLGAGATEILSNNATEALENAASASQGTTVLSPTEDLRKDAVKPVAFRIVRKEISIHTNEIIR